MDVNGFTSPAMGTLTPIHGTDPHRGEWNHSAFIPVSLADETPVLSSETYLVILKARAALAALDATAAHLPNPGLLRTPTLRREAQSTSALEGTYAPLADVLTADAAAPSTPELREVLNYVSMAEMGFDKTSAGYPISVSFVSELQGVLMRGTSQQDTSGRIRDRQVVIGQRANAPSSAFPVHASRFVPAPPGPNLERGVRDLTDWMRADHSTTIDPIVAAAMSHYQFETLHPFTDGNGRVGRYLIILHLHSTGVLTEPTLTVSPWFEARRTEYYDRLLEVSTRGNWDGFIRFFAAGLTGAAEQTRAQLIDLSSVQLELKELVRSSSLRADSAHALIDVAVANPTFTVRDVEFTLGISYGRANQLVTQLVDLGILALLHPQSYTRRFFAPRVLEVLTR
ncbi:Fic family protein [Mycetocola sp. JXN-3]|uniref:Fic family protein n=1 Tax=Mycetocola sp. JXN-3 TaxID=2116510 RepID=UPI00165D1995|nr:Fic/DOC family N-terminal domain-containing protein [Mycetocola sp. JXN-3]